MTYTEALYYLESFVNYEKKDEYDYKRSFKLDRMRRLATLLGNPQDAVRSIHIAGSKGKGSTCAFVHSILKNAGLRTGLYTSPHLSSFRERIRINDELISEDDLALHMEKIKGAVEFMGGDRPSFFEVYTALAFLYFKEKKADMVVYEVGLGGRLDATNLVTPLISAIAPISYEHTDKLGKTLSEIAFEKAGIIKEGGICVSAPQDDEARRIIEKVCLDRHARLFTVGKDFTYKVISADSERSVFSVSVASTGVEYELETALLGEHQIINAATAVGIVASLALHRINISYEAIVRGIKDAKWPGRLEVSGRDPLIVLDGAQNRASAGVLAAAVKKIFKFKRLIMVLGVSKDKDVLGMLEELLPIADSLVLTKSKVTERALDPNKITQFLDFESGYATVTESVEAGLAMARELARPEDMILVTGSLFVVGEARELVKK